jgi:hypothetical protein
VLASPRFLPTELVASHGHQRSVSCPPSLVQVTIREIYPCSVVFNSPDGHIFPSYQEHCASFLAENLLSGS